MLNENRHPGEGAAAGNVVLSNDASSPNLNISQELVPDSQAIHSLLLEMLPYIHVWTKYPDGRNDGFYFGDKIEDAESYIFNQNIGGSNCYFTFNIPTEECGAKPFKHQIIALRGLHVDIDPPKNGEPFNKAETLANISAHGPTVVNDSGGGIHAYWMFPEPIQATPESVAAVEAANRALIAMFNGDPAAPNVDRVMRIPGTINWPDAKKRAAGRGPVITSIMQPDTGAARGSLAELQSHFAPAAESAPASPPAAPVGDIEVVRRLCSDFALAALYSGNTTAYDNNRNAAEMALVNAIAPRTNYNREQTERIWLNSPLGNLIREGGEPYKTRDRADYRKRTIDEAFNGKFGLDKSPPEWPNPMQITSNEWLFAKATPPSIIEYFLYQDVGTLIAAGGTGKTTFVLWLAIHIILGIDFAGRRTTAPGRVVLLTAEDSREMLIARLRNMFSEMFPHGTMGNDEREAKLAAIRDGMVLIDVSANVQRLTCVERDVVRVDQAAVDALTNLIAPLAPTLVVIDPAVSFGVGEARVNDAEQGLIEAGRRIRSAMNAAVFFVHHTGKANARDQSEDQYSGRGGSAFADGSRMVFVMNRLAPKDWQVATGTELQPGETGLKLSIAKLSYAGPQSPLYLIRRGHNFEHIDPVVTSNIEQDASDDEAVFAFLADALAKGETYSRNKLERADFNLPRQRRRDAVARLIEAKRIAEKADLGKGLALIPTLAADIGEGG